MKLLYDYQLKAVEQMANGCVVEWVLASLEPL